MEVKENKHTKRISIDRYGYNDEIKDKVKVLFNFFDKNNNKYNLSVLVNCKDKAIRYNDVECIVTVDKGVVVKNEVVDFHEWIRLSKPSELRHVGNINGKCYDYKGKYYSTKELYTVYKKECSEKTKNNEA